MQRYKGGIEYEQLCFSLKFWFLEQKEVKEMKEVGDVVSERS